MKVYTGRYTTTTVSESVYKHACTSDVATLAEDLAMRITESESSDDFENVSEDEDVGDLNIHNYKAGI